jgi:hypothetical protein
MRNSLASIALLALLISGMQAAADDRRVPFDFSDSGFCTNGHCFTKQLNAPDGSRIVVETFSISVHAAEGEAVGSCAVREVADDGGQITIHLAPVSGPFPIPTVTVVEFIASQMVRVYPRPEFGVALLCDTTDENADFTGTMSGYFLPLKSRDLSP